MKQLFLILVILLTASASATIINIPADYTTILAGIDASTDGDTVLVADGVYGGTGNYNITIGGHAIILMSENGASACTISPGGPENRCFIFLSTIDHLTVVDGFTVYNGTSQTPGAGVYCYHNSSPIIRNCTFNYMVSYSYGGAIYLSTNSNATIENCIFESNTSFETGGAILCNANSAVIRKCQFIWNSAVRGGAIVCQAGGSPLIYNCEFNENHCFDEGGAIYLKGSSPEISYNTITNCWMASSGAGIFCDSSSDADIHDCTISYNACTEYGNGICCRNSSPNIAYCLFTENREFNSGGGGFACIENSYPLISNCVFYRNMANQGGGIFASNSFLNITNSILWLNESSSGNFEIGFAGNEPIVSYCDVMGEWPGEGNIDLDPLFRDPYNGDFHLMAIECDNPYDSPCIDMGHPDSLDLFLNCQWGLGEQRADIGVYGCNSGTQTAIDELNILAPENISLFQNYPNPFNASTVIKYELPKQSQVTIEIYDILGRKVTTLIDKQQPAGYHQAIWHADDFASGMYFYKLQAGDFIETKKMILMK